MASGESKTVIFAAMGANFAIACAKFFGAAVSGSSAMLSEGIHSLVDTGNGGLLLFGQNRAKRPADEAHPFGYGKALYFYTLIVAILIFGVGGGISIYEGILHALHAEEVSTETVSFLGLTMNNLTLNYVILFSAIVFESIAWWLALKGLLGQRDGRSLWETIRQSKDPVTFTVLFEDSAALAGLVVALLGLFLGHQLGMPVLDGIASIVIGLILCGTALLLIRESKGLILGEAANPEERAAIRRLAGQDEAVEEVVRSMTMYMGPGDMLLNLELKFASGLTAGGVEDAIDRVERAIRSEIPHVKHIFVEAESLSAARRDEKKAGEEAATEGSATEEDPAGA
jgi:cation diffusion facilitator family transporter